MHDIALMLKCRSVDIVQASRYVAMRSLLALAETKVSSMNWALWQLAPDINDIGRINMLRLDSINSRIREKFVKIVVELRHVLLSH